MRHRDRQCRFLRAKRLARLWLLSLALLAGGLPIVVLTQDADEGESEPADFEKAVTSIERDLEVALEELVAFRREIAAEKIELSRRASDSARQLRQKQRQYEIAKTTQAAVDHQLEEMRNDLQLWREERAYIDGLLSEFEQTFRSLSPLPEADLFRGAGSGSRPEEVTAARLGLIEELAGDLDRLGQVRAREGEALGPQGEMIPGEFLIAGPVVWFAGRGRETSGLIRESASLRPEVVGRTADREAVQTIQRGESASLSFDPTLGNAIAMEEIEGDWRSLVRKGGIWIYPILFLAVVAFFAAVAKWLQLLGIRQVRPDQVQTVIDRVNDGDPAKALLAAAEIRHPARAILERGISAAGRPVDDIEESMFEKYLEVLPGLQRGLAWIAIASATAPLLGLLGTVTGMIKTFNQITIFGTGDAKSLSSGISEALITTAFGLTVAIPALILHALLSRKVQGIRSAMEMVSLAFINGLKKQHA